MSETCHDCGCSEGQIHSYGCDMESCPFCGGQLISCGCCYKLLDVDIRPGTWAYENGLTSEQETRWSAMLDARGRIPYIQWPTVCARCGALWPDLFRVPDDEWRKYIEPACLGCVLCRLCYNTIKCLIDEGEEK